MQVPFYVQYFEMIPISKKLRNIEIHQKVFTSVKLLIIVQFFMQEYEALIQVNGMKSINSSKVWFQRHKLRFGS